jgi:hypothetical protein
MIREVGDSVFVALAGAGRNMTYVGPMLRFRKPDPVGNSDEVVIGENTSLRIYLRRNAGLARVLYWLGCNTCDILELNRLESGAVPSMESDDYFPPLVLGDSLSWGFQQTYYNTQADWTTWEGVVKWRVAGEVSTGGSTRYQIEREFTGQRRHIAGSIDTTFISGDKSVFVVEDSGRTVRVPFAGNGPDVTYYGPDLIFERYFPVRYGDTILVTQNHWLDVRFRRGRGIVAADYTNWRVLNSGDIPGYQFTYTRRQ